MERSVSRGMCADAGALAGAASEFGSHVVDHRGGGGKVTEREKFVEWFGHRWECDDDLAFWTKLYVELEGEFMLMGLRKITHDLQKAVAEME